MDFKKKWEVARDAILDLDNATDGMRVSDIKAASDSLILLLAEYSNELPATLEASA